MSDDDWGLFGSDDDDEGAVVEKQIPVKKEAESVTLEAILVHIMGLVAENLPDTLADLQKQNAALSTALANAFSRLDAGEVAEAAGAAQMVVDATWKALQENKQWPHQSWCEAHIFGRLLLSYIEMHRGSFAEAVRHVDLALILGAPAGSPGEGLQALIEFAESKMSLAKEGGAEGSRCLAANAPEEGFPKDGPPIRRLDSLSVAQFNSDCYSKAEAAVITGLLGHWEALSKWQDLEWIVQNFGHRTIPVELGRHQGERWTEKTMTMKEFTNEYMWPDAMRSMEAGRADMARLPPEEEVGYIAQHTLFDQLPALRKDFRTPPLCNMGPNGLLRVNAWIGTCGTVTPLHYDSYDNFLCQVVGYKYVRLYTESETQHLYVSKQAKDDPTCAQHNISPIDVEHPDLEQYPKFAKAVYTETVLAPGEMLFIPQGVWHYVRSLSASMSVNFWF